MFGHAKSLRGHFKLIRQDGRRSAQFGHNGIFSVTDSPHILIAPFFELLDKFTGLRSFHAEDVHFAQSAVAALCRAPSLADVRLVRCSVAAEERVDIPSLHLGVSRFSFNFRHGEFHDNDGPGIAPWVSLLRFDNIRELELACNLDILDENMAAAPLFPLVHKLTIKVRSYNLSILSHFPAVEIFSTNGSPRLPASDLTVLPILQQYTGPCETMASFLSRSTLTRLTTPLCRPHVFREQLNRFQGSNNMLSFSVSFDGEGIDMSTISPIRSFFPRLKTLHVRIFHSERDPGVNLRDLVATFFAELGNPFVLPTELERMAFDWTIGSAGIPTDQQIEVDPFTNLRTALTTQYPALRMVWLDGDNFLFCWHKMRYGFKSAAATTRSDAQEMRKEFNDFWRDG
ncbi:hypothetical protein MSAN_00067500 [Mycena sanguinolenta]|uniref:Uncharacterized protein n=1 Tax=Mycena sanguinolenta TaxID=230812 RepID=A0A8H6ZCH6_9AGAR|nr:hypothetical protein MSAN_00067500 [Mycena sanguinolenta]